MADERSLREVNLILLSRLHVAQKTMWKDLDFVKASKKHSEVDKRLENSVFKGFGPDRTPISMRRRKKALSELSTKITPRKQTEKGSVRFNMARTSDQKKTRTLADSMKDLGSILRTPQSQSKRETQEGEGRQHVTFQPSSPTAGIEKYDQSLLGYDWIAGMLDNVSYISQKDDSFFNDLKEFRRVNRSECTGSSLMSPFRNLTKSPKQDMEIPQRFEDEKYHKCSDTYVLDDRLFAVPIHGSDSYCSSCKSRKPAEYENQESYVRISVPRSTLQSPHRVKPHRRKSFDPTDSVSLSKHCLLGWQSSKPAVIPSQSAMDLRAHTGISKVNSLNWSNRSLRTSGPIRSHSGLSRGQSYEIEQQLRAFRQGNS